jgi:predicted unusual protein kinase regulating ubiquinone biosynthesis (AarF/ABC1/UbiB family)
MARLQADAPPMAPELAAEVIEKELGAAPDAIFAEFSPKPLAAASIGQVHAARLADGRDVAVKVQYPGVAEAIQADLRNTELVAVLVQLMRSVVPTLTRADPKAVAAEVSVRITEELDYRLEASNQQLFADAYRGHPFIFVPETIPELSTGRVLTQDLAEGIGWAEAVRAEQRLRDLWGEAIFRFVNGSFRRLHAFNADPHPGNYLFRPDGSVAFLDFGSVTRLDAAVVAQLQHILRATVRRDAPALWHSYVELGFLDATKSPTAENLLEWYGRSVQPILGTQPFKVTPELAATITESFSPTGSSGGLVRSMSLPRDYVFFSRVQLGVIAVLAELRATGYWRSMQAEMDEAAPPSTAMGKAEAAFRDAHR